MSAGRIIWCVCVRVCVHSWLWLDQPRQDLHYQSPTARVAVHLLIKQLIALIFCCALTDCAHPCVWSYVIVWTCMCGKNVFHMFQASCWHLYSCKTKSTHVSGHYLQACSTAILIFFYKCWRHWMGECTEHNLHSKYISSSKTICL